MSRLTVKFESIGDLAEAVIRLKIRRSEIDHDTFSLTAELKPEQIERLAEFGGRVIDDTVFN